MRKHEIPAYTMINAPFIHPLFIKIRRLFRVTKGNVAYTHTHTHGNVAYTHTQKKKAGKKTRTGKELGRGEE